MKEAEEVKKQVNAQAKTLEELAEKEKELNDKVLKIMMRIPNIIDPSVPIGKNDTENVEVQKYGEPIVPNFEIPYHTEIMERFSGIDLDSARKVAGNGFYYLIGDIARLHSAVISYARDFMIDKGAAFVWYFTYMPVGNDAVPELMVTPQQRKFMYEQVRMFRKTKSIFAMDFWNDGEYVRGCIAGGRYYFHINANGDVEPCAFIHYSTVNIKNVSLLEALKSPLFKAYQRHQPFNNNHLRPCPLLDNPDSLKEVVHTSGAYSTDMLKPEKVDDLTGKCVSTAEKWAVVADHIWYSRPDNQGQVSGVVNQDGRNNEKFEKERKNKEVRQAEKSKEREGIERKREQEEREKEKIKEEESALTL